MRNKYRPYRVIIPFQSRSYDFYKVVDTMVDGHVVKSGSFAIDDPSKRCVGMTIEDFALENLLAAGVELDTVSMSHDLFASHEFILQGLSNLSSNVDTKTE